MSENKNPSYNSSKKKQSNIEEIDLEDEKEIIINERDINFIKRKIHHLKEYKLKMDQKVEEIEECIYSLFIRV